jgi:hypothetical protein
MESQMAHIQDTTPDGSFPIPVLTESRWNGNEASKDHVLGKQYQKVVQPDIVSPKVPPPRVNSDPKEVALAKSYRHYRMAILKPKKRQDLAFSNVRTVKWSSLFVWTVTEITSRVPKASLTIVVLLIVGTSRVTKKPLRPAGSPSRSMKEGVLLVKRKAPHLPMGSYIQ